jgi:hypothetical protein|nr:MAG TPA: hypothetical protein [Caudoviricetes sp.]
MHGKGITTFKTSPRQFCKIEKIFVYANAYQLRNKVLAQIEQGRPVKLGKGFDPDLDGRLSCSLQEVRRWYVQHGVPVVYFFVQNPFVFRSDWDNPHKEINYYQEIFPFNSTQSVVIVYKGQWLERGSINVIRLHTEGPYATD